MSAIADAPETCAAPQAGASFTWPVEEPATEQGSVKAGASVDVVSGPQPSPTAFERAQRKVFAAGPGGIVHLTDEEDAAWTASLQTKAAPRSALDTAGDVVQHRRAAYGSPKENFQRIADFWTIALRDKLKAGEAVSLTDVAQMMRLVKEARLIETPDHFDSLVDICGYVDCQQQVMP